METGSPEAVEANYHTFLESMNIVLILPYAVDLFVHNWIHLSWIKHPLYKENAMTSYKELGLVNSREMFDKAMKGKYAIPAYNFNNMEQMQAIIQACVETRSPVILQVSKGARDYANINLLRNMAARQRIRQGAGVRHSHRPAP